MSRIHLLILWVLALIAGVIVFSVKGSKHQSPENKATLSQGDNVIAKDALRTSSGLRVSKGDDKASLLLKGNSWVVEEQSDYPVSISQLSAAFDAVRNLKIVQGLTASSENWQRFGLSLDAEKEADRPKTVTLLAEDGSDAQTIFVGKQSESGNQAGAGGARFIRLSGDDSSIYIVNESFDALTPTSITWIDRQLPKVEAPLRVMVDRETAEDWSVSRKTAFGDMQLDGLADDQETLVPQTVALKNIFSASSFIELLTSEEVEKRTAIGESRTVTVETASGITYVYTLVPEKREDPEQKGDTNPVKVDNRNFMVSFKVTSGPKDPEKPASDANEAAKAGYQALLANVKSAEKTYQKHKLLEGRHYLVAPFVVNPLLKDRVTFIQKKKPQQEAPALKQEVSSKPIAVPGTPRAQVQGSPFLPGGEAGNKPADGGKKPRKRIEAVTPPIAIPQMPKKAAEAESE